LQADNKQQEAIMLYLLGEARPEEVSSLEERLVTDKEFYEEVVIAEDELIDQYLSGELSDAERESFDTYFLVMPERQQKVRFGRALNRFVNAAEPLPDDELVRENVPEVITVVPEPPPKPWYSIFLPSQNPILSYSLAIALVLIVAGGGWFALKKWGNQSSGPIYAVALVPGSATRGEGGEKPKQISIPLGTGTVQLQLALDSDEYATYSAQVGSSEQGAVYSRKTLKPEVAGDRRIVKLDIPARSLTPGDFWIKLSGVQADSSEESLATYYLIVNPR
jgi:hypothetical protein